MQTRVLLPVFLSAVLSSGVAIAQTYNGGVRGVISDPNGALIPNAVVTLTDEATQQVRETHTDDAGVYVFNAVRPATYALHVQVPSFGAADRSHIAIATQDFVTLDVKLAVGSQSESVQVSAQAPLVDTSTASISTEFDQRRLEDTPVLGRNPYITAKLSGVFVNTGNPQFIRFADQNGTSQTSIAGGPVATNLYLVDGVPITDTNNRPVVIPNIEAVQDVKLQALTYDAQVGRTGGGVFNTLLRSGTNTVHGSIFGETRQTSWLANDFFAKRNGTPRPDSPYYNWGASLGGPVYLPHLYDGRNRTFFWIAAEGYIQTSPYTATFVVPTAAQKAGDFSRTFNPDGTLHTIYNPYDTYTDATGTHRRPYANNIITNINPVGSAIASYYPSAGADGTYTGTDKVRDHAQQVTVKLDQQVRPWWTLSGSYIFYEALQPLGNPLHTLPGSYSYTYHRQVDAVQVNSTFILNPTTVITARYGNNRFPNLIAEVSQGFDPAALGFPDSLTNQLQSKFFPTIFLANHDQLGQNTSQLDNWKSQQISATLAKTAGRHNVTTGYEYRRLRMNYQDFGNAPGTYTFSGAFTQADPNASNGLSGSDVADLLLGTPIAGQIDLTTPLHTYLDYNAAFFQDDWRVTPRLTLNAGLRLESESGLKEDQDRLAVGFDRNTRTALPNGVQVTGGILFAGVKGNFRDVGDFSPLKFAPRLGASFQLDRHTVLRGGYGILYAPVRYDPVAALAPGYTQVNSYVGSSNNNLTPANTLSNPYPQGLVQPAGNSGGLLTGAGNSVTTYDQSFHSPRVQQFSAGVERELPGGVALDAEYIGTRGSNLSPSPTGSNAVNINQLSPTAFALGAEALSATVANPYYVLGGAGLLGQSTVSRSQALRPFPQYSSVNLFLSSAHSDYNALLVKAEKRAAHGLNLVASFTWSRNRDSSFATANSIQPSGVAAPQNAYNLEGEYSYAVNNVPYLFTAGVIYDLPFGAGERFHTGARWADQVIGHWQLNVLPTFQSGFPIGVRQTSNPNSSIAGNGVQRPNLVGGARLGTSGSLYSRLNGYINPAAFTASSALTFGNAPRTLSLRGPGYANWDISLFKNAVIRDRVNVQFRAQAFNAFNTPWFAGPNTAFGSSNFGKITAQANFPRYLQLGLHVRY